MHLQNKLNKLTVMYFSSATLSLLTIFFFNGSLLIKFKSKIKLKTKILTKTTSPQKMFIIFLKAVTLLDKMYEMWRSIKKNGEPSPLNDITRC